MNIYLDDAREVRDTYPARDTLNGLQMPDTFDMVEKWTVVRTYPDFVMLVHKHMNEIDHISFDHDLGSANGNWCDDWERHYNGHDAVRLIENLIYERKLTKIPRMAVHSANPIGAARIWQAIDRIERFCGS